MTPKHNPLKKYANNVSSQFGEDGILEYIFSVIPGLNKWCIEFGAWDGMHLSNCYNLIANYDWSAVLIEANQKKFIELQKNHGTNKKITLVNSFIDFSGQNTLDNTLKKVIIPKDFDLLSIDVDGIDYQIWESLKEYNPKVLVIEFNPTIPSDIEFVQEANPDFNHGSSLLSLTMLAKQKGYELIATTDCNAFYVKKEYFSLFNITDNSVGVIWDTEAEAPRLFQLYDGTIVTSKEFDLIWHGVHVNQFDLQKLSAERRIYGDSQKSKTAIAQTPAPGLLKRIFSRLFKA